MDYEKMYTDPDYDFWSDDEEELDTEKASLKFRIMFWIFIIWIWSFPFSMIGMGCLVAFAPMEPEDPLLRLIGLCLALLGVILLIKYLEALIKK